ncbi:hypothetical protein ACROYT_G016862 [Oculina patagonica]
MCFTQRFPPRHGETSSNVASHQKDDVSNPPKEAAACSENEISSLDASENLQVNDPLPRTPYCFSDGLTRSQCELVRSINLNAEAKEFVPQDISAPKVLRPSNIIACIPPGYSWKVVFATGLKDYIKHLVVCAEGIIEVLVSNKANRLLAFKNNLLGPTKCLLSFCKGLLIFSKGLIFRQGLLVLIKSILALMDFNKFTCLLGLISTTFVLIIRCLLGLIKDLLVLATSILAFNKGPLEFRKYTLVSLSQSIFVILKHNS